MINKPPYHKLKEGTIITIPAELSGIGDDVDLEVRYERECDECFFQRMGVCMRNVDTHLPLVGKCSALKSDGSDSAIFVRLASIKIATK